MALINISYIFDPDSVVRHKRSRGAEQDDTTVRRVVHHVVTNDSGTAADADTISPLLKNICPAWTNVVVLNGDVVAKEAAFGDMEARPATRIIRVNEFDHLTRIWTPHFYICSTESWRSPGASSIDLIMT